MGFVFDAAPETRHDCVALCEYNPKLSFGSISGTGTENNHKFIIGENYDALKNLVCTYTKNGEGLIDVIYIDPPYNTEHAKKDGNDYKEEVQAEKFIYRDKFTRTGWLNMMRERLVLARKLLSPIGVIFISIDDNEQAYLKVLCDEIFGENNFEGQIHWRRRSNQPNDKTKLIGIVAEHILVYSKNRDLHKKFGIGKVGITGKFSNPDNDPKGPWASKPWKTGSNQSGTSYTITSPTGKIFSEEWMGDEETFLKLLNDGRIVFPKDGNGSPRKKYYKSEREIEGQCACNWWGSEEYGYNETATNELKLFNLQFNNPKPVQLMKTLIQLGSIKDDAKILDFFAGSGTTGQAVMELNEEDGGNRRCILVTNNENGIAKNVAYERLYRVVLGIGTKGETFQWKYSKEKPSLINNYWDVFEIKQDELKIDDYEKAEELIKKAEEEFRLLNPDYVHKEFDIYNQLASLRPFSKGGK